MTVQIKVYSDYVCPFCFIAEGPLQQAIQGKDVEVEWMPFELRPVPNEPLRPDEPYIQRAFHQSVKPMAERMGLDMVLPQMSPHPRTHLAFEGFQFAKEHGKGGEYNHRIFKAFFQEEQDIGQVDVLTKLAGEVGLDESQFRAALESRTYQEAHQKALHHAYREAGIQVVPTIMIGNHVLEGVRSKEAFEQILNEELKQAQEKQEFGDGMACGIDGCR
ncbi:DsbA family oxidoreductase [Tumebacillus flagellatus]|uniref:2-hydroxychromene-2-carboxylate isomerase n=1 Tax=Tumebacillus flagellatus TaxID=1157490 RepID=A0A074M8M4_9BACL|nr:DsbA family oxidoreductase [Tumebacillus flagellatus]KEO82337.1 2-hydroxychromene-2-carboxylate isomerase [Tumebacillus flagellatus]